MNKWLPTITTIILGVIGSFTPQIQDAIAHHPGVALVLGTGYAILKGLLQSPLPK